MIAAAKSGNLDHESAIAAPPSVANATVAAVSAWTIPRSARRA
jgi:hypothetical protein